MEFYPIDKMIWFLEDIRTYSLWHQLGRFVPRKNRSGNSRCPLIFIFSLPFLVSTQSINWLSLRTGFLINSSGETWFFRWSKRLFLYQPYFDMKTSPALWVNNRNKFQIRFLLTGEHWYFISCRSAETGNWIHGTVSNHQVFHPVTWMVKTALWEFWISHSPQ